MKKQLVILGIVLSSFVTKAANYYWVGGAGNWSDINHWATTSGGAVKHTFVPSQNDDVFFDAGSGFSPSNIVTVNTNATCRNMTWNGAVNTPTISSTFGFVLNIYGSLTLQPNMIYDLRGGTNFQAATLGQTITTNNAISILNAGPFYFAGTGSWILQDAFNAPMSLIYFNNGTLNTNNQTITISGFITGSTSNIRTLSLGSSTITTVGASAWNGNGSNLTLNAGTSTIILNYPDNSTVWNAFTALSGHVYNNVIFNYGGYVGSGGITFNSVLFKENGKLSAACSYSILTFSAGKTYNLSSSVTSTITGQFNSNPGACGGWISIYSSSPGFQHTINMSSSAVVNVANSVMQDIKGIGGAAFTATNSADDGNNTGWTFTTPVNNSLYWIGGLGNWNDSNHWSITSGGVSSGCIPGAGTNVFIDAGSGLSAGNEIITINSGAKCKNFICLGSATTPKLISPTIYLGSLDIYGSAQLQAGMTYSVKTIFKASAAETITSNGVVIDAPEGANATEKNVKFNGVGSWAFMDAFNVKNYVVFTKGSINTNNQMVTMHSFGVENGLKTLNLTSSVINITGAAGLAGQWIYTTGTLNSGTSHIILNAPGTSNAAALIGGITGPTYYDVTFNDHGTISGGSKLNFHSVLFSKNGTLQTSCQFNSLTFSANFMYQLQAGTTQTITGIFNSSAATCSGWITILSSGPGLQPTVNALASATINVSSVIMQDIKAIGGAAFNALNSINNGNNPGWTFGAVTTNSLYWVGGNGDWNDKNHWSTVNNGIYPSTSPCVPGPGDDVFFNANSGLTAGNNTVTVNSNVYCHNFTCSGSATAPAIIGAANIGYINIYGSTILQNGGVYNVHVIFKSGNAETITSNGTQFSAVASGDYTKFDGTGSWTLTDDFKTTTTYLWLYQGTLNTNNKNVTCNMFSDAALGTNTVVVRQINMGSSLFTITGGALCWTYDKINSNVNAGTSHISITGHGDFRTRAGQVYYDVSFRSANLSTILGTGSNFHDVVFLGNGDINGAHVFNKLAFSGGKVYRLESALTQTVNTEFYPSGNPCFIGFMQSSIAGNPANLNVQAGNVNYDYLSVKDIDATPSFATLNVAGHGTDAGNNVNFVFAPTTTVGLVGLGPDMTRCQNQLPLTLNTTEFYPNPVTTFTWTGGTNASTLTVNTGGIYSVTVNYASGCVVGDNVVITANPNPTVSVTGNTVICSGAIATLMAGGASTYTWTNPSATTSTVSVSPSSTTSYSVAGTSTAGCVSNALSIITVTVNTTPTVVIASVSNPTICSGNTTTITPSGASTYTLLPGGTTGTSFNVSPSANTTYTITGTSSSNCPSGNAVQQAITVNTTPTVAIASVSNPTICSGNATTITPSGASTYTLLPGGTTGTSFNVSPSTNTTYTITGTSSSNCPSGNAVQQTITVNTTPTVVISSVSNSTICSGNTSTITPSGASTYTLTSATQTLTTWPFVVTPTVTTTYTLNGTSSANCPSTNSLQQAITVNNLPVLSVSSQTNVSCFGLSNGTVTLLPSGGSGSGYTITPTSTGNLSLGTYTYTLVDGNSCSSSLVVSISQPTASLTSVISGTIANTSCTAANGTATVSVSGGTPSYTVTWDNGSTGDVISNLNTGTHTYTVTDANGCKENTGTVEIAGVTGIITNAVSQTSVACFGAATGAVSYTTSGGTAYTYTLTGASTNYTTTTGIFSNLIADTYTLLVSDDISGCVDTKIISLPSPSNSLTLAGITTTSALCNGDLGVVTATVTGGTPGYNYVWSSNASSVNSATYTAGTYSLNVTDLNNCNLGTQIVVINEPALLTASVTSITQAGCGLSNGQATVTVTGGNPMYTYFWTTASTSYITGTGTTNSLSVGSNTVTIVDANGCSTNTVITITNPNAPVITTTVTDVLCYGDATGSIATSITGTSTYNYVWSNGSFAANLTNIPAGNYSLTVQDNNNCITATTVTVNQPVSPVSLQITTITPVSCYGDNNGSANVLASGGSPNYTYTWQPGNNIGTSLINTSAGNYSVFAKDSKGCITRTVITIAGPSNALLVSLSNSVQPICNKNDGNITVEVIGGTPTYNYTWNTGGAQGPALNNVGEGIYTVIVSDVYGCKDTLDVSLDCKIDLLIPEIFSPNGDGKNDKFEIKAIVDYPNNTITIFNRWGSLVYSKPKYNNEWDGKANVGDAMGQSLLPSGTYYIVLDFGDGSTEPYHGFLQLEY